MTIRDDDADLASALREPRRMLQLVLDTIPARVFWKDRDSRFLGCNQRLADDAGVASPDQVIGKTDHDFPWRDQAEGYRRDDLAVMTSGNAMVGYEEAQTTPDGRRIWLRTSKIPLRDESGAVIGVLGTYEDITEQKRVEDDLAYRLRFETLIAAISTRFLDPRPQEFDADVERALGAIGAFMQADRAYVFLFRDQGRVMDNTHEWCATGIEPFRDSLQTMTTARYPGVRDRVLHGEVESVSRVADLPDDRRDERCEYERQSIRSLIMVPIVWRGEPIGFLGLDAVREERDFGGDSVSLLKIAGDCLASALVRRRYESSLRDSEARLQSIFRASPVGIGLVIDRVFLQVNERVCEMTGYGRDELISHTARLLYPTQEEFEEVGRIKYDQIRTSGIGTLETRWRRKDGRVIDILLSSVPLVPGDLRGGVTFTALDITERRRLEAQIQHVQKLESLGVLAGGIAHDFNNLLMAILGNADLASRALSSASPGQTYLADIEVAARRAADLCRQMLAYSGKGHFVVEPLDLNEVVAEMTRMLEVSISKKAVLRYHLAASLPAVEADATQIRQIVMNLITNASEAIGDRSGVISITTGAMDCDAAYLAETYVAGQLGEGCYVYIEVADTGCGMTQDVKARIFDPFFSTKFTGRGLGLAAVLGIVRGHRGCIKVYSEAGAGSTIKVLLPASDKDAEPRSSDGPRADAWRGAGTVLLVDDEETVRALTSRMLRLLGFDVIAACDGREALDRYRERRDEIVCVVLDLTMPHMDGEEAYRELRRLDPGVRVVMASGYNEHEVKQRFVGKGLAGFIQKPFLFASLQATLRDVLDPAASDGN